jgi:hypothetical protein
MRKYAVLRGAAVERDVEGLDQSMGLLSMASHSADEDYIIHYLLFPVSVVVHFCF